MTLALAPLIEAMHMPAEWWQKTSLWFRKRQAIQEELLRARTLLEKQAPLVQELHALREENRQLKQLLGIASPSLKHWRAAKVVARSPQKVSQRLMLRVDHAHPDDVVVSYEGLVGLVDTVENGYAMVRTIFDGSISVPVTDQEKKIAALVQGQGSELNVLFIPKTQTPSIGTILVTSGSGGIYPPGIPVAKISKVYTRKGDYFAAIEAEPMARWQRDVWLAVVSNQPE